MKQCPVQSKILIEASVLAITKSRTPPIMSAGAYLRSLYASPKSIRIPTGITPIDNALHGGIKRRGVTEVIGVHRSGKTTFCHHFVKQFLSLDSKARVVYISCIEDSSVLMKRVAFLYLRLE